MTEPEKVSRRGDARAEGALLHACFARVLKLDQLGIHSHALAASALRTPLSCHPTLTPVSLVISLTLTVLALVSVAPCCLSAETAKLVIYLCSQYLV